MYGEFSGLFVGCCFENGVMVGFGLGWIDLRMGCGELCGQLWGVVGFC